MGTTKTFEEEVQELARGDSDSLVEFYYGLRELFIQFGKPVIVRRAEPVVELAIGAQNAVTLRYLDHTDRLTGYDVVHFAENRDGDNIVNALVHDLLDDALRCLNGQEIEGDVEVKLAD